MLIILHQLEQFEHQSILLALLSRYVPIMSFFLLLAPSFDPHKSQTDIRCPAHSSFFEVDRQLGAQDGR
jgi:hypothetical protein